MSSRAAPGRFREVERRLTPWETLSGLFVLGVSGATVTCAMLTWLAGRELEACVFIAGAVCLAVWAGIRLNGQPAR